MPLRIRAAVFQEFGKRRLALRFPELTIVFHLIV
jgi:hypothetical protein